ncbi:hypothetical protein CCUG60885_03118 [Mycobacteroides salmoniphilum]|uniref:SnoaL-like domain protein n=1 Tax=Mycobacteroides salmoniphilum TaxID=404941 RepID=A0A4R8SDG7_9MYCO|nr:hypothetical protein CCUG60885_03118 [Mycobacteroides salmoniphilum]TEA09298.1 hypothetical protein CCUG60883_00059 [Mycobacteroides salmoniphilum]
MEVREAILVSSTKDLELVSDDAVRAALAAWQARDSAGWLAAFVDQPSLTDDGQPRDFSAFSAEIGNEYFTDIEQVDAEGRTVTGHFHSETWGDFRTFFRFVLGSEGKFERLEIGQA